jgi:hypothetical protein
MVRIRLEEGRRRGVSHLNLYVTWDARFRNAVLAWLIGGILSLVIAFVRNKLGA